MRSILAIGLSCLVLAGGSMAEETAPVAGLEFISYTSEPGKGLQLQLNLDSDAPQPTSFTTTRPARITFDLPKVKNNLPWSLPLPIKNGGRAKSISAVEANGRTRVVVNLDELVPYTTRIDGKTITINLSDATVTGTDSGQGVIPKAEPAAEEEVAIQKSPSATSAASNSIQNVEYAALPGSRVQVRIKFSGKPREPNSFTISDPARIVLDFPDTASKLSWSTQNVGIGAVSNITVVAAGSRTRVVLGMVNMQPYETRISGDSVTLILEGETTTQAKATGVMHNIESIDFRRGQAGEGRIIVKLSDKNVAVDTREEGGRIVVDFANTQLPQELVQRLDVIDFATPVQYIDSVVTDGKARLLITPLGQYQHMAYQSNNVFTLDIKQLDKKELLSREPTYTGEKLSLNFQDIEVRAVLQLIADFTGLNLVTSDTVQGNLTLRLMNVPWDQALDIVLKTRGLGMRRQGNIMLVAPVEELASREKVELEANKQVLELAPLRFEVIQVNYAKASEMATLLKGEKNSLLSARGNVSVDERTNTLLVSETGEQLAEIRKMVTRLDIPIRQVMIDSRVVIADDDFAKDLGVRFGVNRVKQRRGTLYMNSGSFAGADEMVSSALDSAASTGSYFPVNILTGSPTRLNVNLPAAGAPAYALSVLHGTNLIDLELSALQAEGRGEVISNPRVITSNKQTATIEQGTEIPYQESAGASGATSISFKKAVLSLEVTPQITPDDRIIMDLRVSKDSVGQEFAGVPSINTKEIKTQVLVNNGDTVVLGGVYEQAKVHSVSKVPLLGDIPLLGVLFRSKSDSETKTELLIFVTPKLTKDGTTEAGNK